MMEIRSETPPLFDDSFRAAFEELLVWRRDVRRFKRDPLPPGELEALLAAAHKAPSVGNSQPWRFMLVESESRRAAVRADFAGRNAEALAGYAGERARLYAELKLAGLEDAPVQLAVFADPESAEGHGLGRRTMPETMEYSAVGAVILLWLAARAAGIGVGWLSILDPATVSHALDAPDKWRLIAYLCIGYPAEAAAVPELERAGWQARGDWRDKLIQR
ncbi:MAG: 5,6-dimethylbenzimidazole synthase [Alphaproteobacteria bacterium]